MELNSGLWEEFSKSWEYLERTICRSWNFDDAIRTIQKIKKMLLDTGKNEIFVM